MKKLIVVKHMYILVMLICCIAAEVLMMKYLNMGFLPKYWLIDITAILGIGLVLYFLPLIIQKILSLCVIITICCISYTNVCIYASTRRVFDLSMVRLIKETMQVTDMAIFPKLQLYLLISIALFYIMFWITQSIKFKLDKIEYKKFIKKSINLVAVGGMVGCVAIQIVAPIFILRNCEKETFFTSDSYAYTSFESSYNSLHKFGIFGYYATHFVRHFFPETTPKQQMTIYDIGFENYTSILNNLCENQNVLFIVGESIDEYAITPELTPTLYCLKNGVDFTKINGVSQFYDITTNNKEETEFLRKDLNKNDKGYTYNGLDIYNNVVFDECGLNLTNYKSNESTSTAEYRILNYSYKILQNEQYTTNYIHCNEEWFYNRGSVMGPSVYNFDNAIFYDEMKNNIPTTGNLSMYTLDSLFAKYYLNNQQEFNILPNEKFFTWMMTISTHGSYNVTTMLENYYAMFDALIEKPNLSAELRVYNTLSGSLKDAVQNYYCSVMDTEMLMTYYINELYNSNRLDETIIVFVGDHNAYSSGITTFKHKLYEYNNQTFNDVDTYTIPCIIYSTNIKNEMLESNNYTREINHITSAYDIMPTLYELLGIKYEQGNFLGYPVINIGNDSKEILYNPVIKSSTYDLFMSDIASSHDGETFNSNEPLNKEYKDWFVRKINTYKMKEYYLVN